MGLCAPWANSYLHNWINTINLYHQILMAFILTTVMCASKTFKTLLKWTFPCDIYKSIYVDCPSYFTAKTNLNNNQQESFGTIDLKTTNQFMITSSTTQQSPLPWLSKKKCRERNPIDLVWIHSTDNFKSHPRTSFKDE